MQILNKLINPKYTTSVSLIIPNRHYIRNKEREFGYIEYTPDAAMLIIHNHMAKYIKTHAQNNYMRYDIFYHDPDYQIKINNILDEANK